MSVGDHTMTTPKLVGGRVINMLVSIVALMIILVVIQSGIITRSLLLVQSSQKTLLLLTLPITLLQLLKVSAPKDGLCQQQNK